VAAVFDDFTAATSWGSPSVDLSGYIVSQLAGIEVWTADQCTRHQPGWFSHRRNQTKERLATIGWLP
jgi:copper oxidase (laccase) domain-containing protein